MSSRLLILVMTSALGVGACTTVGGTPATTPPTTEPPATTSTVAVTTTVLATSTTLDRVAEIQAIFEDLERRRLQAILDQDEEAFRSVFANEEYEERSMIVMDLVTVLDPIAIGFEVIDVYVDDGDCIAVGGIVDASLATEGGGIGDVKDFVIERTAQAWGLSWVGKGWRCDGPHPFSE